MLNVIWSISQLLYALLQRILLLVLWCQHRCCCILLLKKSLCLLLRWHDHHWPIRLLKGESLGQWQVSLRPCNHHLNRFWFLTVVGYTIILLNEFFYFVNVVGPGHIIWLYEVIAWFLIFLLQLLLVFIHQVVFGWLPIWLWGLRSLRLFFKILFFLLWKGWNIDLERLVFIVFRAWLSFLNACTVINNGARSIFRGFIYLVVGTLRLHWFGPSFLFILFWKSYESFLDLKESIESWLPHLEVWPGIAAEDVLSLIAHNVDQVLEVVLVFNFYGFFAITGVIGTRIGNLIHLHLSECFFGRLGILESHQTQVELTKTHRESRRSKENSQFIIFTTVLLHVAHNLTLTRLQQNLQIKDDK